MLKPPQNEVVCMYVYADGTPAVQTVEDMEVLATAEQEMDVIIVIVIIILVILWFVGQEVELSQK